MREGLLIVETNINGARLDHLVTSFNEALDVMLTPDRSLGLNITTIPLLWLGPLLRVKMNEVGVNIWQDGDQ